MHGHSDGGLGRGKNSLKYIINLTLIEILQYILLCKNVLRKNWLRILSFLCRTYPLLRGQKVQSIQSGPCSQLFKSSDKNIGKNFLSTFSFCCMSCFMTQHDFYLKVLANFKCVTFSALSTRKKRPIVTSLNMPLSSCLMPIPLFSWSFHFYFASSCCQSTGVGFQ